MSESSLLAILAPLLAYLPGIPHPAVMKHIFAAHGFAPSQKRDAGMADDKHASPDPDASKVATPAVAKRSPYLNYYLPESWNVSCSDSPVDTPVSAVGRQLSDDSASVATETAGETLNVSPIKEAGNGVADQASPALPADRPTSVRRKKAKEAARSLDQPALPAGPSIVPPSPPPPEALATAAVPPDQPTLRLIRKSQVCEMVGFGASKLAYLIDEKHKYYDRTFPQPVKSKGSRTNMWCLHEVQAWIKARADLRKA